ncbi:MAG: glycosyltransferase family 4 protein [Acidimicrobiales bacterium]|nr:glycosyltransferase family 4 protein [Acidimicrobiales bacterium]
MADPRPTPRSDSRSSQRSVAYVLKGYPRLSELFIASEIWRLEQLGVPLRLYVIKPADEDIHHPVVDRIRATPTYLPPTTSLSASTLPRWLAANLGSFRSALARVARRHPRGFLRAAGAAGAQSVRARKGWKPRSLYVKEFLLAVALVDQLDDAADVGHLHAHFAHGCTTVTWLASLITGTSYSFTGHAKDIYRGTLNPAGLLARKLRSARFALTCTGANLDHLHAVAPDAEVHLAYHGLNADFTRLLEDAPAPNPPDHLRIVSVGRLVPKKGFDVMIRAVGLLRDRGLQPELVIAGESGSEAAALTDLVDELGLGDVVRMRGTVTQAELLEEYRRSTLFALACRVDADGDRDGIPNVLVEAMASGLPVVATAVSGIPELIRDGENGLLVPPEDPDALADAIWRIAKDPATVDRLTARGRSTVATHFDGDRLARRLAELFDAELEAAQ